jgi:hypothetical protein
VAQPEQTPARPFAQPKSGNTLPQDVKDKLPPGLRDMPENHPGLANHLRKLGVLKDYPAIDPVPADVRAQLPPGLRNKPYDHPGVANHLGKLGYTIDDDGLLVTPKPAPLPTTVPTLYSPPAPWTGSPFGTTSPLPWSANPYGVTPFSPWTTANPYGVSPFSPWSTANPYGVSPFSPWSAGPFSMTPTMPIQPFGGLFQPW